MATQPRHVLLTNDDGIHAEGLAALADVFDGQFERVTVVAPDREQSGASHALTLHHPLRVWERRPGWYAVDGTPTDCVNLAFFQLLDRAPDAVVSGINAGFNLGEDVTYSGTVAGALEGRILGAPSVAVSAAHEATPELLELSARVALRLLRRVCEEPLPGDGFLNVNVPLDPRGFRVTRQGRRGGREGIVSRQDPKGRDYYWIGIAGSEWTADPHADHAAVDDGYVSVTPLHSDLTYYRAMPLLDGWGLEPEKVT